MIHFILKNQLCYYILILSSLIFIDCSHEQRRTTSSTPGKEIPSISFEIQPISLVRGQLKEVGRISGPCAGAETANIYLPLQSDFQLDKQIKSDASGNHKVTCENGQFEVTFKGLLTISKGRCQALEDELYCLNNSAPNPEVDSEKSYYNVDFKLPDEFSALTPDSKIALNHGYQFQIAKLNLPLKRCRRG